MTQQPQPPQQPTLIKLASEYRETMPADVLHLWARDAVGALRRLHEEAVDLRVLATSLLNKNGGLRLAFWTAQEANNTLRARVQELGEMLRENRSKRIVALEAENLGLLHALAAEQDANTDLRQQLEAIGAGGVEPLRKTNSLEICGIKTHHGQLLRAALQEAEAALEIALARILKRDPGHSVNVTSEAKALVIVRNALDESNHPDHFPGATEMVPVGWAISYDGKNPHALWTAGEGDLLDLEVKRQGGTACKMALYARVEK